jgi:DNA repair protein RAD5
LSLILCASESETKNPIISIQVANTIEGRILQIQKRKTAIVKEAFRGSGNGKGAGADPESIENLKIMFGDDC